MREGRLPADDDKPVWFQGASWLLSTLHRTVEPRPEWPTRPADSCAITDEDDRMFFLVSREGKPLRKALFFSEAFAIMALSSMAAAGCGDRWSRPGSYSVCLAS